MGNLCCDANRFHNPVPRDRDSNQVTKVVLVGDTFSGKSCLIQNYLNDSYEDHYHASVLDVFRGRKSVNRTPMQLEIHDTTSDENLFPVRKV